MLRQSQHRPTTSPLATVIDYDSTTVEHFHCHDLSTLSTVLHTPYTTRYIHLRQIESRISHLLEKHHQLHPDALRAVVTPSARPYVRLYENTLLVVAHLPVRSNLLQTALLCTDKVVVCVQSGPNSRTHSPDLLLHVLRNNVHGVRNKQVSDLMFVLMHALLESFFPALELAGEELDTLEQIILSDNPSLAFQGRCNVTLRITQSKRYIAALRTSIWPMRHCLMTLSMLSEQWLSEHSSRHLRDAQEIVSFILDVLESYRLCAHSLLELQLARQNNRMQEVMQTLTIVTTIFVPLTFLAGIEGMNFKYMPELLGKWSYSIFWVVVAVVVLLQIIIFRKKGWM